MNKKVRIGVLGCANIAIRSILPSICALNDKFVLTSIASRYKEKADKYAAEFNTEPFYSYLELIKSGKIDAVYIPLPNSMHKEWVEKALYNGIHVLVEKSLACTYDNVVTLNSLAFNNSLALVENFQFRFHSKLSEIINIINNGKIGELRCVRSSFGFPPFKDKENIRYKKELGGGALLDAGTYPLKISQIILGDNIEVSSANLCYNKKSNVDIWGGAYLKQKKTNLFSEIAFGFDNYYQCNIEIWGSKGKLSTNRIFTAPPGYEPIIEIETPNGKEIIKLQSDNHFINMLSHFYTVIFSDIEKEKEYKLNNNQARLISELKTKADE